MAWDTETEKYEIQEKWHEKVFRPAAQGLLIF
jgi:hypothetical protein